MKMTPNFAPLDPTNLAGDFASQLRLMISDGRLNSGDKLPATRKLSAELGVARGTIISGLETLIAEGFLDSRHGSGTYVSESLKPASTNADETVTPPLGFSSILPAIDETFSERLNFQACRPSMEAFPLQAWRKAMADAASQRPIADYGDPQGEPELRIAIASYLCRARGLDVNPDQILITNGAVQAIHLIARQYLQSGDCVAFEDPGYPLARQIFTLQGADVLAMSIDNDGAKVEELSKATKKPKLVYVTPSHQFPTGARLSLDRRQNLIEWATQNNALILEDDYDGEFRYDIAPLPPMAAMTASGFVLYLGTFSKTMFPGLRLGYAAGNKEIIKRLTALRVALDYQTPATTQIALAKFISNSEFERHIHRMRRIYSKKRSALKQAIEETNFPGALCGINSGLNGLIELNTDLSASNISARARLEGMIVPPISRYNQYQTATDDALVFGYAARKEDEIALGITKLANIIESSQSRL